MKNNFFKGLLNKNVIADPNSIKEELKGTLLSRWKKQEEATNEIAFDELYNQMVEEAILVIKEKWTNNAEYGTEHKYPASKAKLEAHNAFFITEDRKLYSENFAMTFNPKTGKSCFFSAFTFKSDELIEQYIADVLAGLPEGTTYKKYNRSENVFGNITEYSFTIEITNLQCQ